MEPALILPPEPDRRWKFAKQIGVETAVVNTMNLGDGRRYSEFEELLELKNRFAEAGFNLQVIEESFPLTDTTVLGCDGRDKEINAFCDFLRNAGRVGIPIICYDWMASRRWSRTSTATPARGNSLTTSYDHEQMECGPDMPKSSVRAPELWDSLEYFLERVVPVAEEAGVYLALHPNDPPLSPIRGVDRIITDIEAYDQVLSTVDSPHNGVAFCQGNFAAMGVDIPETIRHFSGRINYVHFRDVEGTPRQFVEVWHDEGPTDMTAAIDAYRDIGYAGPMRPDHVPTMAGESNDKPGYHSLGRLFAIGYMRGLIHGRA
jgi:mannonate dehydratase